MLWLSFFYFTGKWRNCFICKIRSSSWVLHSYSVRNGRLTHLRELKQPLELPSCGLSLNGHLAILLVKLIMEAGLKGYRIGGVEF